MGKMFLDRSNFNILDPNILFVLNTKVSLIAHPHILVHAISERFLLARATFRSVLASESYWLQLVFVLTIRYWHAPVSVGGLLINEINQCSVDIIQFWGAYVLK